MLTLQLSCVGPKAFVALIIWWICYESWWADVSGTQESKVKYRAAPMFTLHQINAYEDNGFLVMDMCCGDDGEVIGDFTLENLRRESGEEMDKVNAYTLTLNYLHANRYIHPSTHPTIQLLGILNNPHKQKRHKIWTSKYLENYLLFYMKEPRSSPSHSLFFSTKSVS